MTIMIDEINSQPKVLEKVLAKSRKGVRDLCREVRERKIELIYIAARGTSDHAAVYAKYILEIHAGIPVAFAAPSVITVYGGKPGLQNALVIGISQSGKAEDVLEVLRHAGRQGSLTAAITNYEDSPMAKEAAYHFSCMAGEEKSVAATKTFTAQMMIMAMIAAGLSGGGELMGELETVPAKISEFLADFGVPDRIVNKYKDMQECFVLARGTNYSIALEGALKIQETCYVRAKAYAMSDFYHGPLALLDTSIPVFLIAPGGLTDEGNMEMAGVLSGYGIETTAVTNDAGIKGMVSETIWVPPGLSDFTSPFVTAAAMQLFACKLSLAKGLNPDNPRNIKKVTITR
ncbi:MAG: SIS domain-containing protein [Clostridia bacterium]|nr:SIS domain-containing protein [Clostridia bacterium]